MRKILVFFTIFLGGLTFGITPFTVGEELPKPSYQNSVIVSIEHFVGDSTEVDYIKNNFNFGLYAWLSFSKTHIDPDLDWHESWSNADLGIEAFKNSINQYIQYATDKNVKIHIVLCSGLARGVQIYREAKEEDIRNCQWYTDNKLASDTQIVDPNAMNTYIWGTFSRYARKMQSNLEAKAKAALAFLKEKMDENPNVLIALSGWGEAELNFHRLDPTKSIQDYFCGYSPFVILEFRDWIRHAGMYDDSTGKYAGQGYSGGGARYQGSQGLANFNQDFGTSFTTWELKYYNWSLSDDYDSDPTDYVNNDPNKIPFSSYSHGNMMPTSPPDYTAGGFDPPRTIVLDNGFWQLWNLFRETMVLNFVKDVAKWSSEAGIPSEKWFSHQIPSDYLFGTSPDAGNMGGRYYTSASPLWTADIQPYGSVGATIYDIKFPKDLYPPEFARTTEYGVPAVSDMASNWAIMEYDAETYPPGYGVSESTAEFILDQFLGIYDYNVHLINFWRWWDSGEHRIKGMNKETALGNFIERIRDKARRTNLSYVFDPPKVVGVSGLYNAVSGAVEIDVSGEIWNGENWEWKDWGDFKEFVIYRGYTEDFTCNASSEITRTTSYSYDDTSYDPLNVVYYKIAAININDTQGPLSSAVSVIPRSNPVAILNTSRDNLYYTANLGGVVTSPQEFLVINDGTADLNWTIATSHGWISVDKASGTNTQKVSVTVDPTGLPAGDYNGSIMVLDSNALNSPQQVNVYLSVKSSTSNPFGSFATPSDNSTVRSSIPVTGWALDDIEVESVKIYRDPLSGEPTQPNGLVYIGDAVFVEGARPDVEKKYPSYPLNYRAGWGYMLLTYGLPDRGMSQTYTLHAIAYDKEGKNTELGTKTITCDNQNAVKPFGAIATPAQGGEASGSSYINWGWALTPLPNMIPTDGSTIDVIVDGVALGNAVYNNYRSDIATLFPEYLNSYGAAGYFYLDTTTYENGVHTIAWRVEDNAGNIDGIGSRYFSIINTNDPPPSSTNSTASQSVIKGVQGIRELQSFTEDFSALKIKKGFHRLSGEQYLHYNPTERAFVITMEEVNLIRIKLSLVVGNHSYQGYLKVEEELRPLPIGSTLDQEKGIFYWQPGPGFLGKYNLVFIDENEGIVKNIKIIIKPKTFKNIVK